MKCYAISIRISDWAFKDIRACFLWFSCAFPSLSVFLVIKIDIAIAAMAAHTGKSLRAKLVWKPKRVWSSGDKKKLGNVEQRIMLAFFTGVSWRYFAQINCLALEIQYRFFANIFSLLFRLPHAYWSEADMTAIIPQTTDGFVFANRTLDNKRLHFIGLRNKKFAV